MNQNCIKTSFHNIQQGYGHVVDRGNWEFAIEIKCIPCYEEENEAHITLSYVTLSCNHHFSRGGGGCNFHKRSNSMSYATQMADRPNS